MKRAGLLEDARDPAYKLAEERAIHYGKGGGGGGGKYVPGKAQKRVTSPRSL